MSIEVTFENLHDKIQQELIKSKKSILIAVAWITFEIYTEIFKALIDKGVKIDILCTNSPPNRKQMTLINELRTYGIGIRLYEMPLQTNHMHHKFAIIDSSTILNGSFNWSNNAKKSFENLTIIKNDQDVVTSFINEFEKIKQLDKKAIRSLQSKSKCKESCCDGYIANILVFQASPLEMTYEVWGDIIECCSVCGEESYNTIESGVQDTYLHNFLCNEEFDFDDNDYLEFNRDKDSYLTGYSTHGVVIHGIGFVVRELLDTHIDDIHTRVVWKNKFVSDAVRDRYESDFGVFYS